MGPLSNAVIKHQTPLVYFLLSVFLNCNLLILFNQALTSVFLSLAAMVLTCTHFTLSFICQIFTSVF